MIPRAAVLFALALHLSVGPAPAQASDASAPSSPPPPAIDVRSNTPSGYPVPRFLSLKEEETNCRIGPSFEHPVRFVFKRAGAPVLVVAESVDHWRKIRDPVGDECWVHRTTLKAPTHVLVLEEIALSNRPAADGRVSGRIGAGVLARVIARRDGWVRISAGEAQGWVEAGAVWGGDARLAASAGR